MFVRFDHLHNMRFSQLTQVYAQTLGCSGNNNLLEAEQDFYQYLQDVFFVSDDAFYAVWLESEKYVCALRIEPYKDGYLLAGLETCPQQRGKGYAKALVSAVIDSLKAENKPVRIYAHILKSNIASIRVHERCGFEKTADLAAYIDGSVSLNAYTYRYIFE